MKRIIIIFIFCVSLISSSLFGQWPFGKDVEWYIEGPKKNWTKRDHDRYYRWRDRLSASRKAETADEQILPRQKAILNGNKITTEIWNYGSISSPGNRVTDIVWETLGYGYEFGPFICAKVPIESGHHQDAFYEIVDGDTNWYANMISDGLTSLGGEVSPDGLEFYGWEPLAFNDDFTVPYGDPNSENIPTSNDLDRDGDGKPDSWPFGWYNSNLKDYVWPGALRQGASNSDLESFFVVDDRTNKEFQYYPFTSDSSKRGLGIEIESRYYQWANPLAEDIIFLIYKVTNKSDKDLEDVTFGMWGDPHVGGPSNWQDDLSFFDQNLNMVYCWDADGISDVTGRPPGYFGYKFLESPGQPYDGIDNDGDGMIDERQDNGIDEDGDWNIEKHDVGIDGVPNTGDEGEDDGIPTPGDQFDLRKPGEPNIDWTDLDESDMVGLTGFASPPFTSQNRISNYQFSFDKMLSLQGNTAPYLLYALVRIAGISRKGGDLNVSSQNIQFNESQEWDLIRKLLQLDSIIAEVEKELLPNRLCGYLFELSQTFNRFYDQVPILKASEPARTSRLALCSITADTLKLGMSLLGIPTLERM